MDRFRTMEVFVRVVEAGSFRKASAGLRMSPQAVGAHIRFLEDSLGALLLNRTTRAQNLTEAGLAYYERCRAILADVAAAHADVTEQGAEPRGRLRISAPVTYGSAILMPLLTEFLAANPHVTLDLDISDRPVDLIEQQFDLAVRVGQLPDSTLMARRIADYDLVICASREFLASRGPVDHPEDLRAQPSIVFSSWSGVISSECRLVRGNETASVPLQPRALTNDARCLVEAACGGIGVAIVPEFLARPHLEAERLTRLLPDWEYPSRPVHLLFAGHRQLPRRLRALIDFLAARLPHRSPV